MTGERLRRRATRWMIAVPAWLLLPLIGCPGAVERVRIVLITLDTLRYDSFTGRREHASDMPHLQTLANGARVFRRHYSVTSSTQPTHASLFTGLPPWRHGVVRNGMVLDSRLATVAEAMQSAGFETGAVVASFPLHHRFGFDQGFDRFDDDFTEGNRSRWNQIEVPAFFFSRATDVTDRALRMLDELDGPRQFFWFHYFDAHQPYGDSSGGPSLSLPELKRHLQSGSEGAQARIVEARQGYDRDVRYLDTALDRLWRRLLADAQETETHILVVSDHGESFGEDLALGHGESLTREQIHVPLFHHSPRVPPGVSDVPVGSIDVAATLLSLAGLGPLNAAGLDLTLPLESRTGEPVVGMRRTFLKPHEDVLADGSVRIVDGLQFYRVAGEQIYRGNASEITLTGSSPASEEERRSVKAIFRSFEEEIAQRAATELLDEESQRALEALGYIR